MRGAGAAGGVVTETDVGGSDQNAKDVRQGLEKENRALKSEITHTQERIE